MALTLKEIVAEVRTWPPEQVTELVDQLASTLHGEETTLEEWRKETRGRIAEIESGEVQGIPGDEVSARIRRIVGA